MVRRHPEWSRRSRYMFRHHRDLRRLVFEADNIWCVCACVELFTLHYAWVTNTVISCWSANAASGFLERNGENETVVEFSSRSCGLDGIIYLASLVRRVICLTELSTGTPHQAFVVVEPSSSQNCCRQLTSSLTFARKRPMRSLRASRRQ